MSWLTDTLTVDAARAELRRAEEAERDARRAARATSVREHGRDAVRRSDLTLTVARRTVDLARARLDLAQHDRRAGR